MEKINKLRKILVDNKLDGYLIQKMMNFLESILQIITIDLNILQIFQDLMVFL